MKHLFSLLAAMLLLTVASQAQTLKDFFAANEPLTYLGVDFTQARVIGETADASEMRDRLFPAINTVILNEPKKYDIAGAFHKQVTNDLTEVKKHNEGINTAHLISDKEADYSRLQPADIEKLVKGYHFGKKRRRPAVCNGWYEQSPKRGQCICNPGRYEQ